ncbi:hypothetical protein SCLCIDRAFT_162096 [Scleroderma citrinum Foug A]|uniref:Uncharacterized protein n=1 Tax=Scleroderma citrinum Foug A TaxID=1036808 RepID=A0A0C3AAA2_9AGAM|nr:hypothetical protein SCLCIDRAFT_162096 [Scleroderma citrinum Foug A]
MEGSSILNPICIRWNCFVILILASLDIAALAVCAWTVGHKEAGLNDSLVSGTHRVRSHAKPAGTLLCHIGP